jgi:sentrin-specific protease 1
MGTLTNDRKRAVNFKSPSSCSPEDSHVYKKPRYSPSYTSSSKSAASKISLYPSPVGQLPREVHAPCRPIKFGSRFKSDHGIATPISDAKGKKLFDNYKWARNYAFHSFRYHDVEEVFNIKPDTIKDVLSNDSSVEEVELVEDSFISPLLENSGKKVEIDNLEVTHLEKSSKETDEILAKFKKLDEVDKVREFQPSSSSGLSNWQSINLRGRRDDKIDILSVPSYTKLLDSAKKRDEKLTDLSYQIKLQESFRAALQITPTKKKEEDVVSELFVPLTDDEEHEVALALSRPNGRMTLVTHENSNMVITVEMLRCLRPRQWLSDEVINVYLELLKEREIREPKKYLKCHFFNTFFYKKLFNGRNIYDYKSVKRWTTQRKLGYSLLDCDKIFVPVHKEVHWCLAVINKKEKKFQYLDSLGGVDAHVMKVLARYYVDEVKDKSGEEIDVSSWKQEYVEDIPDQENGYDCGVFMIKYADFFSRDIGVCFKQEHMPYFRLRTAKEILRLTAQ